ncbi:hypothetical protein BDR26DRAFT_76932 [Obelidium mucronatum]|nr:hypothetical protein BDR26DRAFT_76932 [Obelidium mucronatum]
MATAAAPEDMAPFNLYNHLVSMNVQFKYTIDAFKRVHLLIGHGGLEFVAKPSKTQLTKQRHQSTLWKYAENFVRSNLHQLLPTAQHHIWVVCPSTPNNNQNDKLILRLHLLREENALSPMGYLFTCPPNQLIMGISDGLLMAFGNYLRVDVSEFGMFSNWYAAISPAILTGFRSETSWAVEDNTGIANGFACVVDNTLGYVVNIRDGRSLMEAIEDCFRTLADDFRFPSHIESDEAGNCVKIVMPLTGSDDYIHQK